jgi:hypothetical protein
MGIVDLADWLDVCGIRTDLRNRGVAGLAR